MRMPTPRPQRGRLSPEPARAGTPSACHAAGTLRRVFALAFLLAGCAFIFASGVHAQSAEDLWREHVGSDDGAAPRIVSIHRHNAPEHTRNPDHFFRVTFSEPVANVDTGDFDALGAPDEWWRVWGVQRQGGESAESEFLKACRPDYDRIGDHLGPGEALDLLDRLDDECRRREGMSRQFVVEVGSREVREGSVRTVRLAMASGQDLADAYGNRLDPGLPVGSDYQTFTVDRVRPRPVLSADVDTHDGPGPFNHFYITIDFGEPVNGTFSSRFVQLEGADRNGGWFSHGPGDRRYPLSIGPTGTGDIVVTIPAGAGVEDLAGNPNLAAEPLVIPYRPGALNLAAPPDRTFTAGVPVDVALPEAFRPPTDATYELSGQDGAALPSWLSFDPATRRMSGTPLNAAPPVTLDYTARAGNAFRTVSFTVTVGAALGVPAPAGRTYTAGEAIQPLTLPAATGGRAPLRYALDGLPAGLEFDPDRRRLSGTPEAAGSAVVTYRVTDANNTVASAAFSVIVTPAPVPGVTVSPTALSMPEGGSRTYTVVLDAEPEAEVYVMAVTSGNGLRTSPGRAVFSAANWDAPQTFTVSAPQDGDTDDETGSVGHVAQSADPAYNGLAIARVAVTVEDDDSAGIMVSPTTLTIPEGEARSYEVRLGSRPSASVRVYVRVGGSGADFACCGSSRVTFTPGSWERPRTFTVTALEDEDTDDGTLRVGHFAESADPAYHGLSIATVTATAVDNDEGAPLTLGQPANRTFPAGRSIGTPQLPVAGGGSGSYTYSLTGQGDAALPTWLDFDPATRRMSGTPQAVAAAVTLDYTVNDGDTSVTRSFTVTVEAPPPAGVMVSTTALTVPEGQTRTYTLVLDTQPTGNVTVTLTHTGDADLTVAPAAVTFTTTNWNAAQTITATAEEDTDTANGTATITHAVASADLAYDGVTVSSVTLTERDNDTADTTLSALTLAEADGTAVTLDPVFASDTATYTASVANDVATVTVSATATATGATVAYTPADADTGTAGHQVSLTEGVATDITATVTNGTTTGDAYTITVTRAADTTLSALTLAEADGTAVTLDPVFASDTATYTASVANDVATVTVSATATATGATVAYTPADADTGTAGHQVSLTAGVATDITATVTNGTTTGDAYTITVTRAEPLSWSATLTIGSGSEGNRGYCTTDSYCGTNLQGDDAFGSFGAGETNTFTVPGTSDTVTVNGIVWDYEIDATLRLYLGGLPAAAVYDTWTIDVNGTAMALSAKDRVGRFVVVTTGAIEAASSIQFDKFFGEDVTPPGNGATVTVCIRSTTGGTCPPPIVAVVDTTLSALELAEVDGTAVTLDPVFAADTTSYTASVENDVDTVTVTATATATGATVAYTPADADSDSTNGHQVSLTAGEDTDITATVTNGATTGDAYTITVTRAPTLVWSATLYVVQSSAFYGYCGAANGSCNVETSVHGALNPLSFTVPGTADTVSVNDLTVEVNFGDEDLFFSLTPPSSSTPAAPVPQATYEAWTLDYNGIKLKLSEASSVRTIAANQNLLFTFEDAVSHGTEPTSGYVAACLTTDGGDCPAAVPPPDTSLSALELTAGGSAVTLDPVFASDTTAYTAEVTAATVTVSATPTVSGATVEITPADADSDSSNGHQVALDEGGNRLHVTVTNDFFTGESYTIDVTRAAPALDWSATLTVGGGSGYGGYCGSDCTDSNHGSYTYGTLSDGTDNAFTNPGTGDTVTVKLLNWVTTTTEIASGTLLLRLSPLPEQTVYEGWTLGFGDSKDVALSANNGVTARGNDGVLRFNNFFSGITTPSTDDMVTITLTSGAGGSSGPSGTQAPGDGLQARFGPALAWHTGMAFWTELHFSAEPKVGYLDVRETVLDISGGRIARAQRLTQGSNAGWRLQIVPDGFGDIALTLPPTTDCAAEGAVCTAEGEPLAQGIDLSVPGPGDRLAASLTNFSAQHSGDPFEAELSFSHEPNVGYRDVRDTVFEVTGGEITRARRAVQGSNRLWGLVVEPAGLGDVTITLPETQDCDDAGAVCTRDGTKLEQGFTVTMEGPTAFSVSDAEVNEAAGATLSFEVSLNRPLRAEARVDVATRDGTATAGADYVALAQTLVFAPGETLKTVEVTVLDDAHDEGTETLTLVLSNASGAQIADAEGTGSIANSDAIPKAWLARFGRTVTGQVLDAVEDRLAAPRQASMRATLAGQALPLSADEVANDLDAAARRAALRTLAARTGATDPSGAPTDFIDTDAPLHLRGRTLSGQDVLTGTAFTLTGPAGPGDDAYVSLWGRAMISGFNGNDDGLALDGRVTTSLLGVDWATEGWTAGLSFGHSTGSGGYREGDCGAGTEACAGAIEASLTGLYPYAGFNLSERLSLWLAAGLGAGQLTVHPHGVGALATDLGLGMGAAGLRSELLDAAGGAGIRLALKGDARFTRTWSEAVSGPHGNLASADADVWLVRAGIEGSRRFALGASTSLIPSLEIGVRRDGGDADAGFGADVGVGLALADVQRGLRLDLRMRTLAAHEAAGFQDWGASASLTFDPRPANDRGLSMSLRQAWGAAPSGGMEALLRRDTMTGLANSGVAARGRLEATLSYGVPVFGGALTGAPSAGVGVSEFSRDYRLGWRLTPAAQRAVPFEVNLDATRRESALTPAADHGVMLRGRVQW